MLRWYLIHTKPSRETVALENLQQQGYEVYLPRVRQTIRWRGRRCERIGPLFPRYLFLQLNEGRQALSPIRSSVGVASIVRFGASYAIVPDGIVRELRQRADPQSGLHCLGSGRPPSPGAAVYITMGPFEGLEGIFEREAGHDRVVVLLNLLGQAARVRVPAQYVLPGCAA